MKIIPLLGMVLMLVPGLSFARTDCRVVEFPDHSEAVCVGDEKAVPAPVSPSVTPAQLAEPQQQAAPGQPQASLPAPTAQPQSTVAAATAPQTSATPAAQGAIVRRQGRQQYMKGMEEARAGRLQLIQELQQSQPTP
jgi:hypothetical protein